MHVLEKQEALNIHTLRMNSLHTKQQRGFPCGTEGATCAVSLRLQRLSVGRFMRLHHTVIMLLTALWLHTTKQFP